MPTMTEPRELLLHELGDLLYAENVLVKALPKMAKEATDAKLRASFEKHLGETKGHVENLKAVFESLGEKAKAEKCPAIDGIKAEHDEFISGEKPADQVRDIFLTGSGSRAEHYEIAAYTGIITMARAMGEMKAVTLLEKNLAQEEKALADLTATAQRLSARA